MKVSCHLLHVVALVMLLSLAAASKEDPAAAQSTGNVKDQREAYSAAKEMSKGSAEAQGHHKHAHGAPSHDQYRHHPDDYDREAYRGPHDRHYPEHEYEHHPPPQNYHSKYECTYQEYLDGKCKHMDYDHGSYGEPYNGKAHKIKAACQGNPSLPANAPYIWVGCSGLKAGATCTATCVPNFLPAPAGAPKATCSAKGNWQLLPGGACVEACKALGATGCNALSCCNAPCNGNECCFANNVTPATGLPSCAFNTDCCDTNSFCDIDVAGDGTCKVKLGLGGTCSAGVQCASGFCTGNPATPGTCCLATGTTCSTTADCCNGYCNGNTKTCTAFIKPGEACNDQLNPINDQCKAPGVCNAITDKCCLPNDVAGCSGNAGCCNGYCNGDTCRDFIDVNDVCDETLKEPMRTEQCFLGASGISQCNDSGRCCYISDRGTSCNENSVCCSNNCEQGFCLDVRKSESKTAV